MASIADLMLLITAKDNASPAFNSVAKAADRLHKSTDRAGKTQTAANRTWQTARRLMMGLGASYAAYKVGQFAKESVAAASALQEQVTATDAVFGRNAKAMRAWADSSVESFGQSRREALQYSNSFGTLANSIELGDRKQMSFSKSLTRLASDMASFKNTTIEQAAEALQSGLVGETEPLRKFGIFLNDAKLKAKAFQMGLSDGKTTLDEHSKALAAYEIIMETARRTEMRGDFARTADNYANQVRVLQSNVENLKSTLGRPLMGAANEAFKGFNQTLPALEKVLGSDGADKVFRNFGRSIGDAARWVATHTDDIKSTMSSLGDALGRIGRAAKRVWDVFASLPPGVQETLATLSAAGLALGKIPGAATLGKGIATAAVKGMNVNAGVVNVNGKVSGPGGTPGGKTGPGLLPTLLINPLSIAALTASIAAAISINNAKNNPSRWVPPGGPGPSTPRQSPFSKSTGNWMSDSQGRSMDAWAKRLSASYSELGNKVRATSRTTVDWGNAAKNAAVKGSLGAAAFAGALAKIPAKKDTKVTATGADEAKGRVKGLGGAIGALRGKTVGVKEAGADQSRGRVRNLDGSIRSLNGKTVNVAVSGADNARTQVYNLVTAINSLHDKTVTTYYREVKAGQVKNAATGGLMRGPGTSTSDSIPARLSDGEYVVRAAAVDRYGVDFLHALNAMSLPGYAKGGKVNKETAKEIRQARNEANRQARIARQIEKRGLGDNVITYLGGLSSKAALTALAGTKNAGLRKAARRSGAIGDLQTRRQNARDAARQAREDARQAAEDATAQQQQAAEEAARAAEEAAQAAREAEQSRRDAITAAGEQFRTYASVTKVVDTAAESQQRYADAQQAVIDARKRFDLAGSDRERAAAAKELAAAEAAAGKAAQQRSNGGVTATSARDTMAAKLAKMRQFSAAVKELKAKGLNATTLSEIIQAGPDDGLQLAQAILAGNLADFNFLQDQISGESASLGLLGTQAGQANADLQNMYANAAQNGTLVAAPIQLYLDGNKVWQSMLELQRASGGTLPGLNVP
jgi:hypothetical protein